MATKQIGDVILDVKNISLGFGGVKALTDITTQIKARFVENKVVAASSIRVETLNGVVLLSGFAKSAAEKATAESIASKVNGVKSVRNEIVVQP